jgi:hypothetical protein
MLRSAIPKLAASRASLCDAGGYVTYVSSVVPIANDSLHRPCRHDEFIDTVQEIIIRVHI